MKRILVVVALALTIIMSFAAVASASVYVRGYYRSNGTYVAPHYRSNPDGNFYNNWSTYPNVNPYTGKVGTKLTPSYSNYTSSYRSYYTPSYRSYYTPSSYYNYYTPSYNNYSRW